MKHDTQDSQTVPSTCKHISDRLHAFFQHRTVTMVGMIASLVSIPLAFYFYFASTRSRELSWYAHPLRTNVIALDDRSRLEVRYDGKEVNGNITAVQIALWNAGSQPIKEEDVLESVVLRSSPPVRILDARIRKESRKVSNITVGFSRATHGEVDFRWRVLERKDGAKIQILFEGDPDAQFTMSGTIA